VDWTKGIATCADDKTKLGNYDLDGRCSRSLKVQMGGSRGISAWRSISPWSPAYGQTSEAGLSNPSGILISVRISSAAPICLKKREGCEVAESLIII
jgi:hypothetical protein